MRTEKEIHEVYDLMYHLAIGKIPGVHVPDHERQSCGFVVKVLSWVMNFPTEANCEIEAAVKAMREQLDTIGIKMRKLPVDRN